MVNDRKTEEAQPVAPAVTRHRLTCPMCDFVFLAEPGQYLCELCREAYGPKNQQTKP